MQFEHFSPQSGQISAQFSHPSPQGQTTPQSVQSPHVMQKLSAPAQSTHVPHSVHTSPTEQLEHFSLHSAQTVAQLEHPSPQAHTASTHSRQSEHTAQKSSAPTQFIQFPQSVHSSPSEHSLHFSPHSGHISAQFEQILLYYFKLCSFVFSKTFLPQCGQYCVSEARTVLQCGQWTCILL